MRKFGAKYFLDWPGHKGDPPNGMVRRLGEYFIDDWPGTNWEDRRCPAWLELLAKSFPEYSLCWAPVMPERRQMSQSGKANIRKKRLEARMIDKYPLFAIEFTQEELAADPQYFNAETHLRHNKRFAADAKARR